MRNRKFLYALTIASLLIGFGILGLFSLIDASASTDTQAAPLLGYYVITDKWYWSGTYNVRGYQFVNPGRYQTDFVVTVNVYYAIRQDEEMCKFFDEDRDGVQEGVHCLEMYRQYLPLGLRERL